MRFLRDEQQRLAGPMFRQLYEAEWLDWNLLPAYEFDRNTHVSAEKAEFDPALGHVDVSCDFNVGPMAWALGQHRNEEAWDFDEIMIEGKATTLAAAKILIRKLKEIQFSTRGMLNVYGDASGQFGSTRSRQSDYDILQGELSHAGYNNQTFNVPTLNPPVSTRLNSVNTLMKAATGLVRYWVHPRCRKLADDWARTALKQGTKDLDKSDKSRTHFSDAAGYRLVSLHPVYGTAPQSRLGSAGRSATRATEIQF